MDGKLLLRVSEAVEVLGIPRSTLYTLMSSGEIPTVKIGKLVRIPVEPLREWVERKTAETMAKVGNPHGVE